MYRALQHQTVLPIDNADIPRADRYPLPPMNRTQVYRTLLHQDSMTLQNADVPSANVPPNQAHLYRALLHQNSMTYYRMHWYQVPIDPSLIKHTFTQPYYNQDSMTYYRMHWYLQLIDSTPTHASPLEQRPTIPGQYDLLHNTLVPSGNYPSLIDPTCTEHYYTRTVWPITECIGTTCQLTYQLIQSPTTPGQYDLLTECIGT